MIMLYSGTPGSGKSLHTARDIRDSLGAKRRPVIANFDVNPRTRGYRERFTYKPNNDLTPEFLIEFAEDYWKGSQGARGRHPARHRRGSAGVQLAHLDRGGSRKRMDWIEFFSQHRHFGYKVVLIAQFDRMIDRQIRSLVEIEVNHRKLANFGLKGLLLSLPFGGKLFCAVSYYYGLKEKVGTTWLLPRRAYFRLYDSYNRFEQA